jgi:hypothetical protein
MSTRRRDPERHDVDEISLVLSYDEQGVLAVTALDADTQEEWAMPFLSLVADWIEAESLDGVLHPYLDDTLNVLAMLTFTQKMIVSRLPADDPHRDTMAQALGAMAEIVESLQEAMGMSDGRGPT